MWEDVNVVSASDGDGIRAQQIGTEEDEAAAAQLERLKKLREQAAAQESDSLKLQRHQNRAAHGLVEGKRASHRRSKLRDVNACGLRVSFSDGSALTDADSGEEKIESCRYSSRRAWQGKMLVQIIQKMLNGENSYEF